MSTKLVLQGILEPILQTEERNSRVRTPVRLWLLEPEAAPMITRTEQTSIDMLMWRRTLTWTLLLHKELGKVNNAKRENYLPQG